MSTVNYNLKSKGVRLISSNQAWVTGKNGVKYLNPRYRFVGKIEMTMPNMIVTASDKKKPVYKGSTYDLNTTTKKQIVEHFYNEKGKRNKRTVAYFGIEKDGKNEKLK